MANWQIKVLYDGSCPICRRKADFWRRLDGGRARIALEDITADEFDPADYGLTQQDAMTRIHGLLPCGQLIQGMEVVRRAYRAVGWGWLVKPTAWPVLKPLFDRFYRWFARNRPRVSRDRHRSSTNCSHCSEEPEH